MTRECFNCILHFIKKSFHTTFKFLCSRNSRLICWCWRIKASLHKILFANRNYHPILMRIFLIKISQKSIKNITNKVTFLTKTKNFSNHKHTLKIIMIKAMQIMTTSIICIRTLIPRWTQIWFKKIFKKEQFKILMSRKQKHN